MMLIRDAMYEARGSGEATRTLLESWAIGPTFDVHAAYEFFQLKGHVKIWAKTVWHPCLVPKHAFMLWLCVRSNILTRDKLLFFRH